MKKMTMKKKKTVKKPMVKSKDGVLICVKIRQALSTRRYDVERRLPQDAGRFPAHEHTAHQDKQAVVSSERARQDGA
jgi:hypothetical protein